MAGETAQNEAKIGMPLSDEKALPASRVVKPVALLMLAQVLAKAFLLAREMLVGALFGASALTDAFNVGLYISGFSPIVARPLVEDTFIPVYVEQLARNREKAQVVYETVGVLVFVVAGSLAVGMYLFSPQLVSLVAPGFPPETFGVATHIVRVMALLALFLPLANFLLSTLTAHRAYLLVGLSPLSVSLVTIGAMWLFSGGLGIQSLTWGLVMGTVVQAGILVRGLVRRGLMRVRFRLNFRMVFETLGAFTLLMFWVRLVGIGVGWVDRSLSSHLPAGSIAALGFALNIYQLPFQVCVLAVTTVVITQFSWHVAQKDEPALKRDFSLAVRIAAFFLIPATVALMVLSQPIVQLLYERGAFVAQDTTMTASALGFYALGLVPQAIVFIAVRLFLARKESYLILFTVVTGAVIHVLFSATLIKFMNHLAVALATSMDAFVMALVSLWFLNRKLGSLRERILWIALAKISLAALSMGLGLYLTLILLSSLPLILLVAISVFIGTISYLLVASVLKLAELKVLTTILSRYFGSG
ncbi:MAG: polysaccharide biosynthesis C-terminal domain-containing protein [Anaerolineae bacterium]|nr:polysaccharide biosynthesis C-terminal domain-containing protein [Anaerolineae bacterium]